MKGFNKYQLQEELKKALHNRKQEGGRYFFYEDFISIEFPEPYKWIVVDWKGYQTEQSVKDGCEKILEAINTYKCTKVLNDNTNVVGIWTPASHWVGTNWLPRVGQSGIRDFAWIYYQSAMSRVSTDEAIKHTSAADLVRTFETVDEAKKWLERS